MSDRVQFRRDTKVRWVEVNPILMEGEIGLEIDTNNIKMGDGVHAWNELEYGVGIENITSELGDSENLAASQKLINSELAKKFDKESVVQESGESEDKVMSQKAVSNKLSDLSLNKYKKCHISLIGDSISTFKGHIPNNYQTYYPQGKIDSVFKTYWHIVCRTLGASIQNLSYSGSTVTTLRYEDYNFYKRALLVDKNASLIIVALGVNDNGMEDNLGGYDYDKDISEYDESIFTEAYIKGIRTLISNHPIADICLIRMSRANEMIGRAQAIKTIAEHYGVMYFDASECYDGALHPDTDDNDDGSEMKKIANGLLSVLSQSDNGHLSKLEKLQDNIDFKIRDLKTNIIDLSLKTLDKTKLSLVDGIYLSNGTFDSTQTNYKSCLEYILYNKDYTYTTNPLLQRVALYDKDFKFIDVSSTLNVDYEFSYFRVTFNSSLITSDIVTISIDSSIPSDIAKINDKIQNNYLFIQSILQGNNPFVWEQGHLNNGIEGNAPTRIRTSGQPQLVVGNFTCNDEYSFQVLVYDKNNTFLKYSSWIKSYEISEFTYIRIMMKKDDGSTIIPSDSSNITINVETPLPINNKKNIESVKELIVQNQNDIQQINKSIYVGMSFVWEQGHLNNGIEGNAPTRIRTSGHPVKVKGTIVVNDSGYSFQVLCFDNYGEFKNSSGWQKSYTITRDYKVRIMVKKDDNTDILPSESSAINTSLLSLISDSYYNILTPTWEQGTLTYGVEGNLTTRIRTGFMYICIGSSVKCNSGYKFNICLYDDNKKYIGETGWTDSEYFIQKEGYIRIVSAYNNNSSIEPSSGNNILTYLLSHKYLSFIPDIKEDRLDMIASLQAKNADVVSDYKTELMTADSSFDIDQKGNVYMAYFANPKSIGESNTDTNIYLKLIKFNVCDTSTIEVLGTFHANSDILGFTQGNKPPYDPNVLIVDNTVYVYTVLYDDAESQYYWCILPYNKATTTFGQHIKCKIGDSDFSKNNIMSLYEVKGYPCSVDLNYPIAATKFAFYNGEYYTAVGYDSIQEGNHGGMIIKSVDGINWELVSIAPFGDTTKGTNEMSLDILDDKIYCTFRGYGGTGIFYACYNISSNSWSDIKKLPDMEISKAWMENFENKMFVIYSLNRFHSVNGLARSAMRFAYVETDLSITKYFDFRTDEGCSYPYLKNFNKTLYISFQSDKRHISTGSSRSNICFTSVSDLLR